MIIILIILVLLLLLGPNLWASSILKRHSTPRPDIEGNGAEFAHHLLNRLGISYVRVEETTQGDHYDPVSCSVRLSTNNMQTRSLTAMVVAAHEVGHAMQHAASYRPFHWRNRLVGWSQYSEKVGSVLMLAIPVITLLSRSPLAGGIVTLLGVMTLFSVVLVHLVTLPVEWNASFSQALPILEKGRYLDEKDLKIARKILLACALTYLAQSLFSILNIWRWIRVLRR